LTSFESLAGQLAEVGRHCYERGWALGTSGNFSAVVFADAGNVWNNAWDVNLNDLRYDVGTGLRYMTAVGPFRLDLGYQLNPIPGLLINGKPEPRRFRVHFSIGQAF